MSVRYKCMVCDVESEPLDQLCRQAAFDEWVIHVIQFPEGPFQILACPLCSNKNIDEIFEGHKRRVREGRDLNYH